jgi:hypothetical protein
MRIRFFLFLLVLLCIICIYFWRRHDSVEIPPASPPRADARGLSWLVRYSDIPESRWTPLLVGCELLGCPGPEGVTVNIVPRRDLTGHIRYGPVDEGDPRRLALRTPEFRGRRGSPMDIALHGLAPNRTYAYQFCGREDGAGQDACGEVRTFRTGRREGEAFSFALSTDSHLIPFGPHVRYHATLDQIARLNPDFYITLGDEAMLHSYSAYRPALSGEEAARRYLFFRTMVSRIGCAVPYFFVLGNHDGETGFYDRLIPGLPDRAFEARKRFIPNPGPSTYPEGGGDRHNYYAFTWGGALFVMLDVCTYNMQRPSSPEDWTLGGRQWRWLETVFRESEAAWKFVFAHHLVGGWPYGAVGEPPGGGMWAFPYGRGGAALAGTGEQKRLQALMASHDVTAFFYGHDHVFARSTAGGVDYFCCGQSGDVGPLPWFHLEKFRRAYPGGFYPQSGWVRVDVTRTLVRVSFIKTASDGSRGDVIRSYLLD